MALWRGENVVVSGFSREFVDAPAHRNDGDRRQMTGGIDGREQVANVGRVGLDDNNVGHRRDDMGPFDVKRGLLRPDDIAGRGSVAAVLIDFLK